MNGYDAILVSVDPLLDLIEDRGSFLSGGTEEEDMEPLRLHERTVRLLGDEMFIEHLENMVGRILRRQKPGRKTEKKRINRYAVLGIYPGFTDICGCIHVIAGNKSGIVACCDEHGWKTS